MKQNIYDFIKKYLNDFSFFVLFLWKQIVLTKCKCLGDFASNSCGKIGPVGLLCCSIAVTVGSLRLTFL